MNINIGEKDFQDLKVMQSKQLEILKEIDRVCRKHAIPYYLSSGTLIGVVRHHGFIPWDDDIDIFMHWEYAEKLIAMQDEFQDKYFVQSRRTDRNFPATLMRVCDSETSLFEKDFVGVDMNHGIFVDIYLLYPCPQNILKRKKMVIDAYLYILLAAGRPPYNHGKMAEQAGRLLLKYYSPKRRERKIQKIEQKLRYNNGEELAIFYGGDLKGTDVVRYDKQWFSEPTEMPFEDMTALCPTQPEAYLSKRYGDFMKLPPEEQQVPHHDYVFMSVQEPFTNYKGKYY